MVLVQEQIRVGQKVVIHDTGRKNNDGRTGWARYVGLTCYGKGEWIGIELDTPSGSHDGLAKGKRYFQCPENCGVYVQSRNVLPAPPHEVPVPINGQMSVSFSIED
jgi:dynactin complex subunit